ncbi:MAG: MBL fold metallo-hydrolase [Anaerohalosphaeraceae bacterium]|nr:MBL fold metallo-hydrolase [Anaerohalosphaeraceae bacterium]
MHIETLILGGYENNCYVVRKKPDISDCIIIDTGLDAEPLVKFLQQNKLAPVALILTHGHADHIAGVAAVKQIFPSMKICIHKADSAMLGDSQSNLSAFAGLPLSAPEADVIFAREEKICYANLEFEIIHTPGHTPGGICLYNAAEAVLFSGDTLFAGSIGRTNLPGYNIEKCHQRLIDNIKRKLLILPGQTKVFTGHGPETTIAAEKQTNPYLA